MRVVTRDHLFSNPSMAVMGWSANGKALDEVKRQGGWFQGAPENEIAAI